MTRPVPNGAERVYVCELEQGDVIYGTDETVSEVTRVTDHRTLVKMTNGELLAYGKGDSTILIKGTV